MKQSHTTQTEQPEKAALKTPTDLSHDGVVEISDALRQLLADVFALYLKTKNFHWHMSGRHFRDYHLLLDEQSVSFAIKSFSGPGWCSSGGTIKNAKKFCS